MTSSNNHQTKSDWHHRGYIPHFDGKEKYQSITFRLADSLPQNLLRQLEEDLLELEELKRDKQRRIKIEEWMDKGMGSCALSHPQVAKVMEEALLHFDGDRYEMIAWCIMPNHVHCLIKPSISLAKIVQSWKSYTGKWALQHNEELGLGIAMDFAEQELSDPGERRHFWMREYWDRYIRDGKHFSDVVQYIHNNPVKAGLCEEAGDWQWSSARRSQ